uniref:DUF2177 family protein n=1 Tax=viral metagenome TaxID=1070528 RepID=A0A6C0CTK0_9ZZZZ
MFVKILTTIFVLVFFDLIYFYFMKDMLSKQIIEIQGSPLVMDYFAAGLCYIALAFGLYYFVLREKKSLLDAFLLGIVIYAVYETTTKASLKKWSYKIVVLDTLWGGILFTLTTFVVRKFFAF